MDFVGNESNIPYRELFDAYKNILITNSHNDDPITGELYRYYNSIVFHWEANGARKAGTPMHEENEDELYYSSGVEDAIRSPPSMDSQDDISYHDAGAVSNDFFTHMILDSDLKAIQN